MQKTVLDLKKMLNKLPDDYEVRLAVMLDDNSISKFEIESIEISDVDKVIIFNNYEISIK